MPRLGNNKNIFLSQVQKKDHAGLLKVDELKQLLATYEDLQLSDLKNFISTPLYKELEVLMADPEEVRAWETIAQAPESSLSDIDQKISLLENFTATFSNSSHYREASDMLMRLKNSRPGIVEKEQEEIEWAKLDHGNYIALQRFKNKYPRSRHLDELDDLMWQLISVVIDFTNLNRYLSDWPMGSHADDAKRTLVELEEWGEVKYSGDIFKVDLFRDDHPDCLFMNQVNLVYYELRDKLLSKMKACPSKVSKDDTMRLIQADIFKFYELIDEGLMTEESWRILNETDRSLLPNLSQYQVANPNLKAPEDCTDIYLFGTPGTGKTCLLMGLAAAAGNGYVLNMRREGGPYASALQQYVSKGVTPGNTPGNYVTVINGQVNEQRKSQELYHNINLVEMSGEEFAFRISEHEEVSFESMGTGVTNLLKNNNRKAFFIIVDCSGMEVKTDMLVQEHNEAGEVIKEFTRKRYVSQLDILNKFVGLFMLPENKNIMDKVDAIHFVVTKSDILGRPEERLAKARELLLERFASPVGFLKNYLKSTRRINYPDYTPMVYTFSLGQFYLGDVFEFNQSETLSIVDAIRDATRPVRPSTWLDSLRRVFGGN